MALLVLYPAGCECGVTGRRTQRLSLVCSEGRAPVRVLPFKPDLHGARRTCTIRQTCGVAVPAGVEPGPQKSPPAT